MIAGDRYTANSFEQLLKAKLVKYAAGDITVLIRADQQTPWNAVSEIMKSCARQSVTRVRVAVVDEFESNVLE